MPRLKQYRWRVRARASVRRIFDCGRFRPRVRPFRTVCERFPYLYSIRTWWKINFPRSSFLRRFLGVPEGPLELWVERGTNGVSKTRNARGGEEKTPFLEGPRLIYPMRVALFRRQRAPGIIMSLTFVLQFLPMSRGSSRYAVEKDPPNIYIYILWRVRRTDARSERRKCLAVTDGGADEVPLPVQSGAATSASDGRKPPGFGPSVRHDKLDKL